MCASKWHGQGTTVCLTGKAQLKSVQLILLPKTKRSHQKCLLKMDPGPRWLPSRALGSLKSSSSWPKPRLHQRVCRGGYITELEHGLSYWCRHWLHGTQNFQQGQLQIAISHLFSVSFILPNQHGNDTELFFSVSVVSVLFPKHCDYKLMVWRPWEGLIHFIWKAILVLFKINVHMIGLTVQSSITA